MIEKLILGRFVPGESLIHGLDARTKLLAGFYYIGILFLANNWWTYALMVLFTLMVVQMTGIKLKVFIKGVKPLIWLILFTVVMQILFASGGTIYFDWGPFTISSFGLLNGVFVFLRFVLNYHYVDCYHTHNHAYEFNRRDCLYPSSFCSA